MNKFEKIMALVRLFNLLQEILEDRRITRKELDELYEFLVAYVDDE